MTGNMEHTSMAQRQHNSDKADDLIMPKIEI